MANFLVYYDMDDKQLEGLLEVIESKYDTANYFSAHRSFINKNGLKDKHAIAYLLSQENNDVKKIIEDTKFVKTEMCSLSHLDSFLANMGYRE